MIESEGWLSENGIEPGIEAGSARFAGPRKEAVQETAAQRAHVTQQDEIGTPVRSAVWVGDFRRLKSTAWRWWPRFSPVGTQ